MIDSGQLYSMDSSEDAFQSAASSSDGSSSDTSDYLTSSSESETESSPKAPQRTVFPYTFQTEEEEDDLLLQLGAELLGGEDYQECVPSEHTTAFRCDSPQNDDCAEDVPCEAENVIEADDNGTICSDGISVDTIHSNERRTATDNREELVMPHIKSHRPNKDSTPEEKDAFILRVGENAIAQGLRLRWGSTGYLIGWTTAQVRARWHELRPNSTAVDVRAPLYDETDNALLLNKQKHDTYLMKHLPPRIQSNRAVNWRYVAENIGISVPAVKRRWETLQHEHRANTDVSNKGELHTGTSTVYTGSTTVDRPEHDKGVQGGSVSDHEQYVGGSDSDGCSLQSYESDTDTPIHTTLDTPLTLQQRQDQSHIQYSTHNSAQHSAQGDHSVGEKHNLSSVPGTIGQHALLQYHFSGLQPPASFTTTTIASTSTIINTTNTTNTSTTTTTASTTSVVNTNNTTDKSTVRTTSLKRTRTVTDSSRLKKQKHSHSNTNTNTTITTTEDNTDTITDPQQQQILLKQYVLQCVYTQQSCLTSKQGLLALCRQLSVELGLSVLKLSTLWQDHWRKEYCQTYGTDAEQAPPEPLYITPKQSQHLCDCVCKWAGQGRGLWEQLSRTLSCTPAQARQHWAAVVSVDKQERLVLVACRRAGFSGKLISALSTNNISSTGGVSGASSVVSSTSAGVVSSGVSSFMNNSTSDNVCVNVGNISNTNSSNHYTNSCGSSSSSSSSSVTMANSTASLVASLPIPRLHTLQPILTLPTPHTHTLHTLHTHTLPTPHTHTLHTHTLPTRATTTTTPSHDTISVVLAYMRVLKDAKSQQNVNIIRAARSELVTNWTTRVAGCPLLVYGCFRSFSGPLKVCTDTAGINRVLADVLLAVELTTIVDAALGYTADATVLLQRESLLPIQHTLIPTTTATATTTATTHNEVPVTLTQPTLPQPLFVSQTQLTPVALQVQLPPVPQQQLQLPQQTLTLPQQPLLSRTQLTPLSLQVQPVPPQQTQTLPQQTQTLPQQTQTLPQQIPPHAFETADVELMILSALNIARLKNSTVNWLELASSVGWTVQAVRERCCLLLSLHAAPPPYRPSVTLQPYPVQSQTTTNTYSVHTHQLTTLPSLHSNSTPRTVSTPGSSVWGVSGPQSAPHSTQRASAPYTNSGRPQYNPYINNGPPQYNPYGNAYNQQYSRPHTAPPAPAPLHARTATSTAPTTYGTQGTPVFLPIEGVRSVGTVDSSLPAPNATFTPQVSASHTPATAQINPAVPYATVLSGMQNTASARDAGILSYVDQCVRQRRQVNWSELARYLGVSVVDLKSHWRQMVPQQWVDSRIRSLINAHSGFSAQWAAQQWWDVVDAQLGLAPRTSQTRWSVLSTQNASAPSLLPTALQVAPQSQFSLTSEPRHAGPSHSLQNAASSTPNTTLVTVVPPLAPAPLPSTSSSQRTSMTLREKIECIMRRIEECARHARSIDWPTLAQHVGCSVTEAQNLWRQNVPMAWCERLLGVWVRGCRGHMTPSLWLVIDEKLGFAPHTSQVWWEARRTSPIPPTHTASTHTNSTGSTGVDTRTVTSGVNSNTSQSNVEVKSPLLINHAVNSISAGVVNSVVQTTSIVETPLAPVDSDDEVEVVIPPPKQYVVFDLTEDD